MFSLAAAAGEVVLKVRTAEGERAYTIEALQELKTDVLRTSTPWTTTEHVYAGVWLRDLVADAGISPDARLRLEALNGYRVVEDLGFLLESGGFLAFQRGAHPMSVREKGPVWLLYPFSERPQLNERNVRMAAVWMLHLIEEVEE